MKLALYITSIYFLVCAAGDGAGIAAGDDLLDGKDSRINIRLKTMRDKNWQEKYEDLMLDMEILSEKSLRLVKEAKGVCYEHNVDEFDWNLTGEVEFIAQKYELRIP